MGDRTIVRCIICGEEHFYPWKKADREQHLIDHMADVFEKAVVGISGGGTIGEEDLRKAWQDD